MNIRPTWLCLLVLSLAGCGKDPQLQGSASDTPSPLDTEAASLQSDATKQARANRSPALSATSTSVPDPAEALNTLTHAVRRYSAEKRRVPGNLQELLAAGYVTSLPAPPPGKKFVINAARVEVVLENQ